MATCGWGTVLLARAVQCDQLCICSGDIKACVHFVSRGKGELPEELSGSFVTLTASLITLSEMTDVEKLVNVEQRTERMQSPASKHCAWAET